MGNEGKQVSVHYVGTLDDGAKFDSSRDRNQPLDFECMAGQMIPGFDKAVKDMEVGQTVTVRIPAAEAYGERDERMVHTIQKKQLPGAERAVAGRKIMLSTPMGPMPALIAEVTEDTVTFDLNHELAGKDLTFEIELLSVK